MKCEFPTLFLMHIYEIRPRRDKRGVDLISDALPFGGLWYAEPNAIDNAMQRNRSHHGCGVGSKRTPAGNPAY
jgi:hypothetical protein